MKTIFEWTFTPENYFEENPELEHEVCDFNFFDGKITAVLPTEKFQEQPNIREECHELIESYFLGTQLVNHKPYKLSNSDVTTEYPDGRRDVTVEVGAASMTLTGFAPDIQIVKADGTIVEDTKAARIDHKEKLSRTISSLRGKDKFAFDLLKSYQKAVTDPDNELVHIYEIREALSQKLVSAKNAIRDLQIKRKDWNRLGTICNELPLRQGRHRGKNIGELRDASSSELQEARSIAVQLIENYIVFQKETLNLNS